MKKALMLLCFGIMVLGAGWVKASPRTDAMSADINVVEDYDLIFTYPNKTVDYKNTVDFRMGYLSAGTEDDWGGILDGKHEAIGVIGVYMHRPDSSAFLGLPYNYVAMGAGLIASEMVDYLGSSQNGALDFLDDETLPTPNPLFDIIWGKAFGNTNLGVMVSYADSKINFKETGAFPDDSRTNEMKDFARQFGIQVGVGVKDLGPFQEANFAAGYIMGALEVSNTETDSVAPVQYQSYDWSIKDDGISSINLNANLRHDLGANDNVKLFANARIESFGLKIVDNGWYDGVNYVLANETITGKIQDTQINVGLGCNHTVNEGDGLVSAGLKAMIASAKVTGSYVDRAGVNAVDQAVTDENNLMKEGKVNIMALPVFVSAEAKVKSWLTLRAGMAYYLYTNASMKVTGTFETMEGSANLPNEWGVSFNTGFGLNWKNWVLDCVLNTNSLEQQISSVQPGRGLLFAGDVVTVSTAALKYKF